MTRTVECLYLAYPSAKSPQKRFLYLLRSWATDWGYSLPGELWDDLCLCAPSGKLPKFESLSRQCKWMPPCRPSLYLTSQLKEEANPPQGVSSRTVAT